MDIISNSVKVCNKSWKSMEILEMTMICENMHTCRMRGTSPTKPTNNNSEVFLLKVKNIILIIKAYHNNVTYILNLSYQLCSIWNPFKAFLSLSHIFISYDCFILWKRNEYEPCKGRLRKKQQLLLQTLCLLLPWCEYVWLKHHLLL